MGDHGAIDEYGDLHAQGMAMPGAYPEDFVQLDAPVEDLKELPPPLIRTSAGPESRLGLIYGNIRHRRFFRKLRQITGRKSPLSSPRLQPQVRHSPSLAPLTLGPGATGTPGSPSLRPAYNLESISKQVSTITLYSSDSEGSCDVEIPTIDAVLDNTLPLNELANDILSLLHTLRISRWKNVPLNLSSLLQIERLSGALTNAVYTVSLPGELPPRIPRPPRLILRIYGPHVENLIDRVEELEKLARLSQHGIGPSLLGIFSNGRFEQFLPSRPLTHEEFRSPELNPSIARRMRELHDRVPLTLDERKSGPHVWLSIERWIPLARDIISQSNLPQSQNLRHSWDKFESLVYQYRSWILSKYTPDQLRRSLVFAHNDSQYGNILKLLAPDSSQTLKSKISSKSMDKQLVVIDFEYAAQNPRAFDLANHFCEWMSNFHTTNPHNLDEKAFPTHDQIQMFLKAYLEHTSSFNDDSDANEKQHIQLQAEQLYEEIMLWTAASHAQWTAWGIIQAGFDKTDSVQNDGWVDEPSQQNDTDFDNIRYSEQRARLFIGDMIYLELTTQSEFPLLNAKFITRN